jgi:hypothetical protein
MQDAGGKALLENYGAGKPRMDNTARERRGSVGSQPGTRGDVHTERRSHLVDRFPFITAHRVMITLPP